MYKWAKSGKAGAKAMEEEAQKAQAKYEANKRMFRFFVKPGEEGSITFIDGNLTKDGILDALTYREHRIMMNGSWNNFFVCTQDIEPCPICETGDTPSVVGVFTVIDHTPYKSKKGEIYKDTRKLFVAKRDTMQMLQKIAVKRGGLAGAKFDVMRVGDKSASVGTSFDFVEKKPISILRKQYTEKDQNGKIVTKFEPADYEKELGYLPAKKLRDLGFGSQMLGESEDTEDNTDYEDEL